MAHLRECIIDEAGPGTGACWSSAATVQNAAAAAAVVVVAAAAAAER
jgi:hypothetical protein